jgi:superfamily I DNA/RNA helicase
LDMRSLARRQLYVAMTRAQDELHLVAGEEAAVVSALDKSSLFLRVIPVCSRQR